MGVVCVSYRFRSGDKAYAWKFWSKGIRVAGLFGLVKTWNVSFNLDVELYVKRESVGSQEWSKICYN